MDSMKENEKLERLDHIGSELVRVSQMTETEVRETVSQPFLYARIRARIDERQRMLTVESNWWASLLTAWRPLAGMAVMAIISAALFLFSATAGAPNGSGPLTGDDEPLATGEPRFERIVFTDSETLSNDEVLATIMNQDETDGRR